MELDLQSFFGLHVHAELYSLAETPQPPPPPPHLGSYTMALLVSQDRRHIFETLWRLLYTTLLEELNSKKHMMCHGPETWNASLLIKHTSLQNF